MANLISTRARAIASEIVDPTYNPANTALNLRTAENWMIREELIDLYCELLRNELDPSDLSYGKGFGGDPELLEATAAVLNDYFNPADPVSPDDVVITTGASLALNSLMDILCNEGDEVLITAPHWNGFDQHLVARNGVKLRRVYETSADIGVTPPEKLLTGSLVSALTDAYESSADPSRVKALVITNAHNPYGRYYPESVIKEAMLWCGARGIHYVSDEVYALSELTAPKGERDPLFVSALAVKFKEEEYDRVPEASVIWGTSKDLCSSGLRVGVYVHRPAPESAFSRVTATTGARASLSASLSVPLGRNELTTALSNLTNMHLPTLTTSLLTKGLFKSEKLPDLLVRSRMSLCRNYEVLRDYLEKWNVPYVEPQGTPFVFARLACVVARKRGSRNLSAKGRGEPMGCSCSWKDEEFLVKTLADRAFVLVAPGRQFHVANEPEASISAGRGGDEEPNERAGWVRITIGVPRSVLEAAIARIAAELGLER
ncbi:pyridoxal phosphate-dependent transferase [Xylaria sp. FL0933]|nr:pyridoxal phosphate-dependent transferase [Xylaria sp. FL0933]